MAERGELLARRNKVIRVGDLARKQRRRAHLRDRCAHVADSPRWLLRGTQADMWFSRNGIPRKTQEAVDVTDRELKRCLIELTAKAAATMVSRGRATMSLTDLDLAATTMGLVPCRQPVRHQLRVRRARARARVRTQDTEAD
jgi:hypothetical protein